MLISPDEINKSLSTKGWSYKNNSITKTYNFDSFMNGIKFINKVAHLAEAHNHHPNIKSNFCDVIIDINSHDMGGVTTKCVNLATAIDLI